MKKQKIVIVTPFLNEEPNIIPFITEVKRVFSSQNEYQLSFLFIDDGSIDLSWKMISQQAKKDSSIAALKLSRNFGSHTAWYAGLTALCARGDFDRVVLITVDLQDPPDLIPQLLSKLKNGVRVAWAVRKNRKDIGFGTVFSRVYYKLVRLLALPNMPEGGMDFCALDRKIVTDVVHHAEKNTSILGLIMWLGYKQEMIPYTRKQRLKGASHWTLAKKLKLFTDTFVAFSYFPIRLMTYIGFIVSLSGFFYAGVVFVRRLIYGAPIEGWSSLMLVVLILSGIQLLMLGIVAEYLWRTLDETRKRPMYLVDQKLNL